MKSSLPFQNPTYASLEEGKLSSVGYALTPDEVEIRESYYGKNQLATIKPTKWYKVLYLSIIHPFNAILLALAIIAISTLDFDTFSIMLIMIFLSVLLRFWQELKANVAFEALKRMVRNHVTVVRMVDINKDKGDPSYKEEAYEILLEDLVPGDIVKLSAGSMIPGDLKLMESKDLFISQSSLTGEAMPLEKLAPSNRDNNDFSSDPELVKLFAEPLKSAALDRPDLCFMGASVVSGTCKGLILHTGDNTVFGDMAKHTVQTRQLNDFQKGVRHVSIILAKFMLVMVPIVFVLNGSITKDWLQALLFAVAVGVGLTPEMLPMIVNANLARSAVYMAKRKAITKRIESIMNLGAMDILCTDKTGTLTQDKVALIKHLDIFGSKSSNVLEYAYLNSHYQTGLKNLLDIAVMKYFEQPEYDTLRTNFTNEYTKIDEIPFDFKRRRMSVILERASDKKRILVCKGAVEELTALCTSIMVDGKLKEFDEETMSKSKALDLAIELNKDGLRVIAVAIKNLDDLNESFHVKHEVDLTFIGFVAFLDPPKPLISVSMWQISL
jgi:Mg2+-importing ATPase